MRDYATDQEQIAMIKQWWHDYGKYLLIAVVIGIGLGLLWRGLHQHQLNTAAQASQLYQQLLIADVKLDRNLATDIANDLTTKHADSPYAVMANLLLAKESVQDNKLDTALQQLQWVIDHGKNPSFKQIARIRSARILLSQHQAAAALQILAITDDPTFAPAVNLVKGDIYLAQGDKLKAKQAYVAAQQGFSANGMEDNVLKLKLAQPLSEINKADGK